MVCHAFADFVFQPDTMAKGKRRSYKTEPPPGIKYQATWFYWLTAHAIVHGSLVALITNNVSLGILEIICHWMIDFGKCENKYGIHTDQLLHFLCKLLWLYLM